MRTISKRSTILRRCAATSALTLLAGLGAGLGAGVAQAQEALPVGGTVAAGAATITAAPGMVTVDQSSARAIVNWRSFDVGAGNTVVFRQPDAASATLNRVTGGTSSTIAGQIVSNGAVYLVNPNGIAITSTGSVQTGGGFVASTLAIADADFAAGKLAFAGSGASGRVSNAGTITAGAGGYVALLGGAVSNAGTISVPLGKVALGSGENIALDLNGDNFLQVAAPTAALTGDAALIDMAGSIAAAGGRVELRAASVRDAVRNVINLSGGISADSASGDGGSIVLFGHGGGTVSATGTLSARATGASGNGGFVETSGATVDFTGLKVDTSAANGTTGTWLVDPTDLTVDAASAATISTNLATSNVTLQTTFTMASGPGNQSPGDGNITIASAIGWTSANTLSLLAFKGIALNAAITGTAGGLTLTAGNNVAYTGAIGASGAVNVGTFNLTNGDWAQNIATLPAFSATDFRFDVTKANFLRVTGGNGSSETPYRIADVYGLQGMASTSILAKSFALANAIDASGTAGWNANLGFVAIGTNGAGAAWNGATFVTAGPTNISNLLGFSGSFDGTRLAITGLTIDRAAGYQGLFGFTSGSGTIADITLTGSVRGGYTVGSLIGHNRGTTVTDVSSSVNVTGDEIAGGLIGFSEGPVSYSRTFGTVTSGGITGGLIGFSLATVFGSSASGAVTGVEQVGGLIGDSRALVLNSSASGKVLGSNGLVGGLIGHATTTVGNSTASGAVTGQREVGGLIGFNEAAVTSSSASGAVTGQREVGGLIGYTIGSVSNATATGAVDGTDLVGGLIGRATGPSITATSATGAVTGTGLVGGLIGGGYSSVSLSFATGAVRGSTAGGLIGFHGGGGTVDQAYATGAVTGTSTGPVGGLIGGAGAATVSRSYATGSVTTSGAAGSLIGSSGATITQSYGTGRVSGSTNGGLIGSLTGGNIANSVHWDSYSTGQASAFGSVSGGTSSAVAVTSDPARTGAANAAYKTSAYANFTASDWVFFDGQTRPFGAWELPIAGNAGVRTNASGQVLLTNSHQLQLVGSSGTMLAASFALGNGIDLTETGRVVAGTSASYTGMWAGTGFVPLGTNGAGLTWDGTTYRTVGTITSGTYGYSGTFDGGGYTLSNLSISRVSTNNVGLFGTLSGTVRNISVGGTVIGSNGVGGLVGMMIGGPTTSTTGRSPVVSDATSSVNVTGAQVVGGLVGSAAQRSSVLNSTASGTVSGINTVGGLVGSANRATVTGSASGTVRGQGYVGGLIGQQFAGTTTGYATGAVSGTTAVGGLIGVLDGTATERGTATATRPAQARVTGPGTSDRNFGRVTAGGTATTLPAN